jgi:radical SAM superfamily enzyme YgiQ (UPF0313 family)
MNVLIISANRNEHPVPVMPIGACIVAEAAEKAGHNVRLLDLMFKHDSLREVEKALEDFHPDVAGLSLRNIDNNDVQNPCFYLKEAISLVDALKGKTDATIVLGGPATSVMTEEIMRYTGVSIAVTSDGEVVFPKVLEKISGGEGAEQVPGVAFSDNGAVRRNPYTPTNPGVSCQTPDYRRWVDVRAYRSRLSTVPLQTKLGCHFRCVYCTYRKIEGESYRLFDPESVVDAVSRLEAQGLGDIEFVDNVFNSPHGHAMEICEGLASLKPRVRLQSLELNPLFIDDELVAAMERAGFAGIGITVESASDRVLGRLRKGFGSGDVQRAAKVVRRHGLPALWIFMLGGPGETEETVMETLRFAERSVRPRDAVFFNIGVRVYPGTELESIAREQGVLSLQPEEMLEPVFYISPDVDFQWLLRVVRESVQKNMNFLTLEMPYLKGIHIICHFLGIKSPLWRHTPFIRRALRLLGAER